MFPFVNLGIVDDDVFCVMASSEDLIQLIPKVMQVVYEEYERTGLQLHLKPSKTAVVVTWRGEGSAIHRERFQHDVCARGGVPFLANGKELLLPVSASYVHVGCIARTDDKTSQDVVSKMCRMRDAAKPLKRNVLKNKSIGIQTRVGIVHTHIFPL